MTIPLPCQSYIVDTPFFRISLGNITDENGGIAKAMAILVDKTRPVDDTIGGVYTTIDLSNPENENARKFYGNLITIGGAWYNIGRMSYVRSGETTLMMYTTDETSGPRVVTIIIDASPKKFIHTAHGIIFRSGKSVGLDYLNLLKVYPHILEDFREGRKIVDDVSYDLREAVIRRDGYESMIAFGVAHGLYLG